MTVRIAVVGVGGMGASHARVVSSLKGADLVGVVDADLDRAHAVADNHGCRVFGSAADLIGEVDAVTLAVPSSIHGEVAAGLVEAGIHCLVEKPFVTNEAEGDELVGLAGQSGAKILVGHIERFNPAVRQLSGILDGGEPVRAIDARRMSAVSGRITDVDVVSDLMVHDIDIVLDLVDRPIVDLVARGIRSTTSVGTDYAMVILTFEGGVMASFTASRITQNQVRSLAITADDRFFTVNYPNQELLIYRQGRIGGLGTDLDQSRYVLDVGTERVFVRREEPLVAELSHFLQVVRGEVEPLVGPAEAMRTMRVVWDVQDQLRRTGDGC